MDNETAGPGPDEDFPDPLFVARRELGDKFDDLDQLDRVVLREGPRSKKIARFITIKNRHTGDVHHHTLTIESGQKRKGSWELDDRRSLTLSDDGTDEIGRLVDFIQGARAASAEGLRDSYVLRPQGAALEGKEAVAKALRALPPDDQIELLAELVAQAGADRGGLRRVAKWARSQPAGLDVFAAALAWGRFSRALDQLERLIAEDAEASSFQLLLAEHPWLLGSEHGEAIDWIQGLMLRRRADGHVELVDVHTPLGGRPLLGLGRSHYPGAELSQALGEAAHHLESLAAGRAGLAEDAIPAGATLTAKIVIGTDGDEAHQAALRRLNGHLDRIEVLTFNQLLRIGRRVLASLAATIQGQRDQ